MPAKQPSANDIAPRCTLRKVSLPSSTIRRVELTVGEVAERCGLKPSTVSEHLGLLRRGGLVVSRKEGREVFYRADGETAAGRLSALQAYLAVCCPPGAGC
ncbi:metalloregulator ArsR/SmtB family transcription factor [Streptomyces sp. 196(2019)]|nr:metalloregulator ArsR/SmtB family transcription factor [Streptomyces sp. 196(2019)]